MGRLHREQDESFGSFSKKGQEIGSIPGGIAQAVPPLALAFRAWAGSLRKTKPIQIPETHKLRLSPSDPRKLWLQLQRPSRS
ncbi:hypothetical protein HanPI659440_MTg0755181 (mitochondrion) [Helianthus annuus]|nr:hypothetical protein HanPI659440_MTg0755181 [Helianthus annuus]